MAQPFALRGTLVYVIDECEVRKKQYGQRLRGGAFEAPSAGRLIVAEGGQEGCTCGILFSVRYGCSL
jgi:hypothetical protein